MVNIIERKNNIISGNFRRCRIHCWKKSCTSLWPFEDSISSEIGYCIFPEYRGHGYCVEAAKIALKYAFEEWNAHKVVAMCNEYNIASYKVMERIGMVREGVFREELPWQCKWVNQFFYCILDSDYREVNNLWL